MFALASCFTMPPFPTMTTLFALVPAMAATLVSPVLIGLPLIDVNDVLLIICPSSMPMIIMPCVKMIDVKLRMLLLLFMMDQLSPPLMDLKMYPVSATM